MLPIRALAAVLLVLLADVNLATAQVNDVLPNLPRELVRGRLQQQGDKIRLCINPDSMLATFETQVATELGDALLLEAEVKLIQPILKTLPYDYRMPLNTDQIYVMLEEECDGYMGFTMASESYPTWMQLTAPYLSTGMVMVTSDPNVTRLEDLPHDRPIGARGLSSADYQLILYLKSLPAQSTWKRHSYFSHEQVLEALRSGAIGAALFWEPALLALTDGDPAAAGLTPIDIPFPTAPVEFGIVLKSNDAFLRDALSQGIASMQAGGRIEQIFDETVGAPRQ